MKALKCMLCLMVITLTARSQSNRVIPLGHSLEVEVPLQYNFKAGTESISKTVYVGLRVDDLTAYHKPLKAYADGGLMGGFSDEQNVTTWFTYTEPRGLTVDGEFIAFSQFAGEKIPGGFTVENARFTWTIGASRYAKHPLGSPTFGFLNKREFPGYEYNIINMKDIIGTETSKEAMNIARGRGAIEGYFLEVDGLTFNVPYELKQFLVARDEKNAKETGYYTANGFRNKVKEPENTSAAEYQTSGSQGTGTTNNTGSPGLASSGTSNSGSSMSSNSGGYTNSGGVSQSSYANAEAWQKYEAAQKSVEEYNRQREMDIQYYEQQRQIKQQTYERIGETVGTIIGNYLNHLEQEKQRQEYYKQLKKIKIAVNDAYGRVWSDISYWDDYQSRLIELTKRHRQHMTTEGLKNVENALNSINGQKESLADDIKELGEREESGWKAVEISGKITRFPVSEWKSYVEDYRPSTALILYDLNNLLAQNRYIRTPAERERFTNDVSDLLTETAIRNQDHGAILSAEAAYHQGGGSNYSYDEALKAAKAIKEYMAKRDRLAVEIKAEKEMLETRYALMVTNQSKEYISVSSVSPQVEGIGAGQKELRQAYNNLDQDIGVFKGKYRSLSPSRDKDVQFEGYYVHPGEVKVELTKAYMDPVSLTMPAKAGERIVLNPDQYLGQFEKVEIFKPYFRLNTRKNQFELLRLGEFYATNYHFGINEFGIVGLKYQTNFGLRTYQKTKTAFHMGFDFGEFAYGMGKIRRGTQNSDGSQYEIDVLDFSYWKYSLGSGNLGLSRAVFADRGQISLNLGVKLLEQRNFSADMVHEEKVGLSSESSTQTAEFDLTHYMPVFGSLGLNYHIGKTLFSCKYTYFYYPEFAFDDENTSELIDEAYMNKYNQSYFGFLKDYFTHAVTFSIVF
ncbi:MAG TPA: hypothetical protein DCG19_11610 [Cryomorphaceae bacterium]|nr:hypothetical protein [Cryomorphaceae bacterium]